MAINYNVNPYYDDYDQTKQFYRILFRPGRAVQARELTQIQTSLQKQIERFGQGIYKEGSMVVPGGQLIDRKYPYVKLTDAYNTNVSDTLISSLINDTITGANSGVTAVVVNSVASTTTGDPSTIYVRYTSSNNYSTGANTTFQAGEVITNASGNITLQVANTTPTGFGTLFAVTSGVVFTKGVFAYFDNQNYIVEKYAQANNAILGFQVTESTVTSTNDTSLLDPAVGASNYIAPGADRYKIALDLSKRSLTVDATEDPDFVELLRLEDGEVISQNLGPQFSVLGDTLARRTYDESGNYTVKPYSISLVNHLKTDANTNDGLFLAANGGDDNLYVGVLQPGKAYVKGYEVENVRSRRLTGNKAREYANVNNAIISTPIGNYIYITNVYSVPDLTTLVSVSLYNEYNDTPGTANGTLVGTAKIRGLEFYSGTPGQSSAVYRAWLFDVSMTTGYTFERDVKQIYVNNSGYDDFTADINPTALSINTLTGSFLTTNGSSTITGTGTRFNTEVKVGDYITVRQDPLGLFGAGETFRVGNVVNSTTITANTNATTNTSGISGYLNTVVYNETQYLPHLFEMPYTTIRTVDPTNVETSYDVKRSYSRTLSSNAVTITAGTDETFAAVSTTNYTIFVTSGTYAGSVVSPTGLITRGGSPTGKTITIDLTSLGAGYATESIVVITTVQKTNSAADKKTKTLVTNATIDFTDANTAQASVLSLGKADIYRIVSVSMGNTAFGTSYSATGATNITERYTLDNGQKLTYYDIGKISLKPNQSKPTGPVRVTFDYFTHGTGDYFSVDSYAGIDYKDIPSFTSGSKTYQLRDCLDFRPRINDAGTGFSGTGAVVNDFLDPASDVQTDYSYYLPRTDKIVLNKDGVFKIVEGVSSLNPKEPRTPDDSMALFVLKQKAYVFDTAADIDVVPIDNKRFTMRDIGRIENRVKNLEYYTTLSLLEKDTQSLQIQDGDGFDRFKNGFIVDNFAGHGIGDVFNRDYGVSIDYNKKELRPLSKVKNITFSEINNTTAARTANNYTVVNDLMMLPYTEVAYVQNQKGSRTENINPFSVITWRGTVSIDPAGDMWYEDTSLPTLQQNDEGLYDQFIATAQAKGTYGTIWGSWRQIQYGDVRTEVKTGQFYNIVEQFDSTNNNDVVINRFVVPKMRNVTINFTGEGLKPNTRIHVFFDNIRVTEQCSLANTNGLDTSNSANIFAQTVIKTTANNLITDSTGKIEGTFYYNAKTLDLSAGLKAFRLTDSPTNSNTFETIAETTFIADGQFNRPPNLNINYVLQNDNTNNDDGGGSSSYNYGPDIYDYTMEFAGGGSTYGSLKDARADDLKAASDNYSPTAADTAIAQTALNAGGGTGYGGADIPGDFAAAAATASPAAAALWSEIRSTMAAEVNTNGVGSGAVAIHYTNTGGNLDAALDYAAYQVAAAIIGEKSGLSAAPAISTITSNMVNNPINKK